MPCHFNFFKNGDVWCRPGRAGDSAGETEQVIALMLLDYKDASKTTDKFPNNIFDLGDGEVDFRAVIGC